MIQVSLEKHIENAQRDIVRPVHDFRRILVNNSCLIASQTYKMEFVGFVDYHIFLKRKWLFTDFASKMKLTKLTSLHLLLRLDTVSPAAVLCWEFAKN